MASHFNKIQWTEGMLLKPQHFQQQERHFEHLIKIQLTSLNRFFWGFSELEIDKDLLKRGYLVITKASGYFPDGTHFDIPKLSKAPEALTVEKSNHSERIYLSLTEEDGLDDEKKRYEISTINIKNTESEIIEEAYLDVKTPKLTLFQKDQVSKETNYLTVAELIWENTSQEINCNENHIPTIININICNRLILNLKFIVRKIQEIIEIDRPIQKSSEYNCYIKFQYMSVLKKSLHTLQHLLSSGRAHPESTYLSLLELASGLSCIHQVDISKNLYNYQHEDLFHSFNPVINFIKSTLDLNPYQDSREIILKENQHGFWISETLDKKLLNKTLILCIKTEEKKPLSCENVPKHLKIATPKTIYTLIKQALPGIALTHLKSIPNSIPANNNELGFLLEKNSSLWAELTQEPIIALHGTLILGKFQPRLWVIE